MKANTRGYYCMGKDRFYVEFDRNGELKLLSGYPNDSEVCETKKNVVRRTIEKYEDEVFELITWINDFEKGIVVLSNGGLKIIKSDDLEKKLLLTAVSNDYYSKLYADEINKYLPLDKSVLAMEFWKIMASKYRGITVSQAIDYIKGHYMEFYDDSIRLL